MLGLLYTFVAAMLLPTARDLYKNKIDLKIKCWSNILDSPLTWRQREHAFEELSLLYYEQYILDNVPDYEGTYPYLFDLNATDIPDPNWWYDLDH